MKKQKFITTGILAAGALLLAGSVQLQAQTQNYIFKELLQLILKTLLSSIKSSPICAAFYFLY